MYRIINTINRIKTEKPFLMVKIYLIFGMISIVLYFFGMHGLWLLLGDMSHIFWNLIILFIYFLIPLIAIIFGIYLLIDKQFIDEIRERDKIFMIFILVINLIILVD